MGGAGSERANLAGQEGGAKPAAYQPEGESQGQQASGAMPGGSGQRMSWPAGSGRQGVSVRSAGGNAPTPTPPLVESPGEYLPK